MVATYPHDVRVVFKHNPLGFHKWALPSAKAAMAAHLQGKFWEFHDVLFANQKQLEPEHLEKYARSVGLDIKRWKRDMASRKVEKKILHDQASMVGHGARGTPAFFVNGKLVSGARPFEAFKAEVDAGIKQADRLLAAGTKLEDVHAKLVEHNGTKSFVDEVLHGGTPHWVPPKPKPKPLPTEQVRVKIHRDDPFIGPKDAPIVLVHFAGFQCPFSARVGPTLKQLLKDYPGELKIVFKHLPMAFHKQARPAALAALAAHEQGKFWEYHDVLFENAKALGPEDLERYAKDLGLNLKKFRRFIAGRRGERHVERDLALAAKVGARGTPNSFINGYKVTGAVPVDFFKKLIDRELAPVRKRRAKKLKRLLRYSEPLELGQQTEVRLPGGEVAYLIECEAPEEFPNQQRLIFHRPKLRAARFIDHQSAYTVDLDTTGTQLVVFGSHWMRMGEAGGQISLVRLDGWKQTTLLTESESENNVGVPEEMMETYASRSVDLAFRDLDDDGVSEVLVTTTVVDGFDEQESHKVYRYTRGKLVPRP